jgi:outer membrane protein TolC
MMIELSKRTWRAVAPLVAVVLLALVPAAAQEVTATAAIYPSYVEIGSRGELILTPDTAARLVVERNLRLAAAAEGIDAAGGRLAQARAAGGLSAKVSGVFLRKGPVTTFELPGDQRDDGGDAGEGDGEPIELSGDHLETVTIELSKPLYTQGRIELGADMAREGVAIAELSEGNARRALVLASQEGAYAVLRLKQLAAVSAARLTAVAEHVRLSEIMQDAGVVAQFEVVQAQTELSRAQQGLISAQTGVKQATAQLRNLINFPQTTDVDVVDCAPPRQPEGDLAELIERAWAGRPEVKLAASALTIARMNLRLARRDMGLTVALMGSYSRQTVSGFSGEFGWQAGVAIEKPLFDSGARDGKVAEALAGLRSAELDLERTREDVALDVTHQVLAIAEAREKIAAAEQGVVEGRERRRMAQLRYREGITPGIEVIDADTGLAAADANLINAEYDLQLSTVRLRSAMGLLDVQPQEVETQ